MLRIHTFSFSLHEVRGKGYPFAAKTGQEKHVLHGYLLSWASVIDFDIKLKRMDRIEGASAFLCVKCLCYRHHLPAQTSPRTPRSRIQHYLPALAHFPGLQKTAAMTVNRMVLI